MGFKMNFISRIGVKIGSEIGEVNSGNYCNFISNLFVGLNICSLKNSPFSISKLKKELKYLIRNKIYFEKNNVLQKYKS